MKPTPEDVRPLDGLADSSALMADYEDAKRAEYRIEALRAACILHGPASSFEGTTFLGIEQAALRTAEQFARWLETGER